ncbi:MAG TPA: hypothetical protein VFY23_08730, partial [Candidatus Limnocylindrales bacterium]|nr:hypothetical protein [Candidatus Limnocylindrales bacterium]
MTLPGDLAEQLAAWLVDPGLRILLIVIIALVVMRLAHLFVRGLVKALLDRETSEGTAQELSAVEVAKRMD